MSTRVELLACLRDGAPHSGPALAAAVGVSRAAVHKHVRALQAAGVNICVERGQGYRLLRSCTPLDVDAIAAAMPAGSATTLVPRLTVLETVDSTNAWLMRGGERGDVHAWSCIAETQTGGRGRRGRRWIGGAYRNLMLSLAWRFPGGPATLAGLSLAVGVALADVINSLGVADVGLKWPNDIMVGGRKIGGVLIDISGEAHGPVLAIIGVGLNIELDDDSGARIDQPWIDLAEILLDVPDRNRVAGLVIAALAEACAQFADHGLAAFRDRWALCDWLRGKQVEVNDSARGVRGVAVDIDSQGALLVAGDDGRTHTVTAGEVSVRRQP